MYNLAKIKKPYLLFTNSYVQGNNGKKDLEAYRLIVY